MRSSALTRRYAPPSREDRRMTMKKVLLIAKLPLAGRLTSDEAARLITCGAYDPGAITQAAATHALALDRVRAVLAGPGELQIIERRVDQVRSEDALGIDLIVTVGGDGTVLTANALGADVPMLTVNSDPGGSVGHYTRATIATVGELAARWRSGEARHEPLARLTVSAGAASRTILNDCLITNINPAATSRYWIQAGDDGEMQRSSGVWVSTAAGSTGAIRSAGAEPVPSHDEALLWKVREPFEARGRFRLLSGRQRPPVGLDFIAAIPGMSLYLDGPNFTIGLEAGVRVTIRPAPTPLVLLAR